MKKVLIYIKLLLFSFLFQQSNLPAQGILTPYDIYYGRSPSAKAEAMGKGMVANPSNDFASFFNPASSSFSKGLDLSVSFSHSNRRNYNYEGINYKFKNSGGILGINRYYIGMGLSEDRSNNVNYTFYTLNYSNEVADGLFAGANLNLINTYIPGHQSYPSNVIPENIMSASIDIGAIKTFDLSGKASPDKKQMITLGASITNLTFTIMQDYFFGRYNLPVLLRAGGAYNIDVLKSGSARNDLFASMLNVLVHGEYEKELRHDDLDILKGGLEIKIYEILSLRGGIYGEWRAGGSWNNYFTYGAGLNIPINKLTHGDYPFKLVIDYVNLKHRPRTNLGNFSIVSIKLNWVPEF